MAEIFKIDEQKRADELFHRLKPKLNSHSRPKNVTLLFLLTDLTLDEDEVNEELNNFKYLKFGFNRNIKFLVTSKHPHIDDRLTDDLKAKFELKAFDTAT